MEKRIEEIKEDIDELIRKRKMWREKEKLLQRVTGVRTVLTSTILG